MKYFFILNPASCSGASEKSFAVIKHILESHSIEYEYAVTKDLDEAYSLSAQGNREGYDIIVAVGGDGTINRVLNGFYNKEGRRISHAKLGIIYTGTSPDFCRSYNIPLHRKKAIEAAIAIAKKDDIVLIAGKGHEDYQIIGNEKIDFDDREIAAELLRK